MLKGDIYRPDQDCIMRSATGIQMVIFIELVQYAKNLGGKSRFEFVQIFLHQMKDTCNRLSCVILSMGVKNDK